MLLTSVFTQSTCKGRFDTRVKRLENVPGRNSCKTFTFEELTIIIFIIGLRADKPGTSTYAFSTSPWLHLNQAHDRAKGKEREFDQASYLTQLAASQTSPWPRWQIVSSVSSEGLFSLARRVCFRSVEHVVWLRDSCWFEFYACSARF